MQKLFSDISEIKQLVDAGEIVHWEIDNYTVVKDLIGDYFVVFGIGTDDEDWTILDDKFDVQLFYQNSKTNNNRDKACAFCGGNDLLYVSETRIFYIWHCNDCFSDIRVEKNPTPFIIELDED